MGLTRQITDTSATYYDPCLHVIVDGFIQTLAYFMPAMCAELAAENNIELPVIPVTNMSLGDPGTLEPYYIFVEYDYFGTEPNTFVESSGTISCIVRGGTNADGDQFRKVDSYNKLIERVIQKINESEQGYQDLLLGWPKDLWPADINTLTDDEKFLIKEIHDSIVIVFRQIQALPDNDAGKSTFGTEAGVKIIFTVKANKKRS